MGAVKITPAHDSNDYEVGLRCNLPKVVVMNKDPTMNKNALKYEGMSREECHEAIVQDLKDADLLIKVEEMVHTVGAELYKFIWEDFCDYYIELSKANMNDVTKSVLLDVLTTILKLLHPFMPYVTEEIYSKLPIKDESIMISSYPLKNEKEIYLDVTDTVNKIIEDIVAIRNLKASNQITKNSFVQISTDDAFMNLYMSQLRINSESAVSSKREDLASASYKSKYIDITYYFTNDLDDNNKVSEEIEKLEASIERRRKLLANENYVNKAPKNIVDLDKQKLAEEEERLQLLKEK